MFTVGEKSNFYHTKHASFAWSNFNYASEKSTALEVVSIFIRWSLGFFRGEIFSGSGWDDLYNLLLRIERVRETLIIIDNWLSRNELLVFRCFPCFGC